MASAVLDVEQSAIQNWMRMSVANKICVKEALLDILHDPVIGVSKNKQSFCTLLVQFKVKEGKFLNGVIKPLQWQILCHVCDANCSTPCPKNGQTDSNNLDITCIIILIRYLTKLPAPNGKGWKQTLPEQGDTSVAAFVLLARDLRNRMSHCSLEDLQTKADFDREWKKIEDILLGLKYKNMVAFHQLETASLDPYLNQQVQSLKDAVMDLANVEINNLKLLIHQVDQKVNATDDSMKREVDSIKSMIDDHELRILQLEKDIQELKHQQQDPSKKERKGEKGMCPMISNDDVSKNTNFICYSH